VSLDPAQLKRRRNLMIAVNAAAALTALACIAVYFELSEPLALAGFVAAILAGFGVQIWFIAGLRGGKGDV
jgi:hypothetical protein